MMRRFVVPFVLAAFLFVTIIGLSGCCIPPVKLFGCDQPGETAAEIHRRQLRNARINQQELNSDIEDFWLYDEPSKLNDQRIR